MPKGFNRIWNYNKVTGEYYLPNLKSYLMEQDKKYPNMMDLYKHQMDLIKKDYPTVFAQLIILTSHKPTVTVVAGPNGAGKSSLQSLLRQARLVNCNIVNIDALEIDVDTLPNDMLRYEYEKFINGKQIVTLTDFIMFLKLNCRKIATKIFLK